MAEDSTKADQSGNSQKKGKKRVVKTQTFSDKIYKTGIRFASIILVSILFLIFLQLLVDSIPSMRKFGFSFLFNSQWDPVKQVYGALPFIVGTLITSFAALIIAIPHALSVAIFVNEYADNRIGRIVEFLVETLASIPSIIYGFWGILIFVPFLRKIESFLANNFSWIPFLKGEPTGIGLLAAIVILVIMILPYATAIAKDTLKQVPQEIKEAGYGLGSTKFEVIRHVIVPYARIGIGAGLILALGRAIGETMAVTMVIGNKFSIPTSIYDPANTLASVIANEFAEAGDLYKSALIEIGLILFIITTVINYIGRVIIKRIQGKYNN